MFRRYVSMLASATALPLLAGCTGGYVYDAKTKGALTGVHVHAVARCDGTGCSTATAADTVSKGGGLWGFDGYGDWSGASDVQWLRPLPGQDTVGLLLSSPGYKSQSVYHHQIFKTMTNNGKNYQVDVVDSIYLCPTGAPDADGDSVCDAAEASYGTSPTAADTDGDGIDDYAELFGTSATVGGVAMGADLAFLGAKATHKDVFVYYNYYVAPIAAGLAQVVAAFAAAPVSNPDGTSGITLHLVSGGMIDAQDQVANFPNIPADWSPFDVIKNAYFPARYATFMHYALFGDSYGTSGSSGNSRGIPAHDFLVTLGAGTPGQGVQAGTFMHELGHNLGLQHGGNEGNNCKPNYLSLMNYEWQMSGLQTTAASGLLDYSRLVIGAVNEGALVETNGMSVTSAAGVTAATYRTRVGDASCQTSGASHVIGGTIGAALDWNDDGAYSSTKETRDLDDDGSAKEIFAPSQNDWAALVYTGNEMGGGVISGSDPYAPSATPHVQSLRRVLPIVAPSAMPRELTRP